LPDGCLTTTCPDEGHVCSANVHENCPDCPVTPHCVERSSVKRAYVSLNYVHDKVEHFHRKMFKSNVIQSVSYVLSITPRYITSVHTTEIDDITVQATFNIITDLADPVDTYNQLVAGLTYHSNGLASIEQDGATFVPQPDSMNVVYYTTAGSCGWEEDVQQWVEAHEVVLLSIAVATGVFVFVLSVCCCVVACKKRSKRNQMDYKHLMPTGKV